MSNSNFKYLGTVLACAALAWSGAAISQAVSNPNTKERSASRFNEAADADDRAFDSDYYDAAHREGRMELLNDVGKQSENWTIASRFAECVVNLNEDRARLLLDQAVEGKAKQKLDLGRFLNRMQGCVIAREGIDRDFLRAAMAERIVVAKNGPMPAAGDKDAVMGFIQTVKVTSSDHSDPFIAGQLVAECRTGFSPVAARALLATEPGSPAEAGALAAMKAVTPQCDGLDKAKTKLTPLFERAYAAQALYHWIDYAADRK